jgi:serine/threonine protein kinase/tetratricopeptide (TPR) repeat protein
VSRSEAAALMALAESIADGSAVDWDAAESQATPEERDVIRQLRILSNLAGLHRSMPVPADATTSIARKTAAAPAIGSWAHLELIERLGGGTFGDVYRAWDRHLEREVALKLLRAERVDEDLNSSRIANEGRLLARIRHTNVVYVHGVAVHDQRVGLWMELVRGITLEQQLAAHGPFSAREAALIGTDLCHALAAIHAAGLIHRDVKAQNVMREDGGRIVLMDLGTGREADGRIGPGVPELAGTPLYLAPEIFVGSAASARTDLYSLGVLLYHLVTSSFPVRATTVDQLQTRHAEGGAVRLRDARADLPTTFVRVIDRAIASEPAKRYQSAGEFEAALLESLADTTPSVARTLPPEPAEDRPRRWSRAAAIAGAAAAALVVAVLGLPMIRNWLPSGGSPRGIQTLAILPLVNASADSAQEYFADGMTDELIGMLGTVPDINVISRTSVMQFKGSTKTVTEIARALNVDAVLEGSVRVLDGGGPNGGADKRVRLNARLMYAGSESPIWSRTFEAVASEIVSLQQQLAAAIAEGTRRRVAARAERQPAQNFAALDLYLKGRYAWNTRTKDGLQQSIQYFQQAIARDPNYAKAYAGLADAYTMLSTYEFVPYADATARAQQASTKALDLDATLGEAYASLGLVYDDRLDWNRADAAYKRAIDLNPGYASGHHWYSTHLSQRGNFADAHRQLDIAMLLDPLSANIVGARAMLFLLERRYDEAISTAEKALQLNGALVRPRVIIARAYTLQGAFDRASAAIDAATAVEPNNNEARVFTAVLLAASGRQSEALQIARDLGQRSQTAQEGHASEIAIIYATLGDRDSAFEWLERARVARDPWLAWVKLDPTLEPLRSDPRYASFLASLALTQ